MYISFILSLWRQSLAIFLPSAIKALCLRSYHQLVYALKNTLLWYRFFLLIAFFQFMIACIVIMLFNQLWLYLLYPVFVAINFIFLNSIMLLYLRGPYDQYALRDYLKIYFIRYFLLQIFFMALGGVVSYLMSFFPPGQSVLSNVLMMIRIFPLFTMFFWLDAPFRFKNMFIAFASAANLMFLNLPFISAMALILLIVQKLMVLPLQTFMCGTLVFVMIKVTAILFDYFLTSMLYQFYKQYRNKESVESVIE